VLIGEDSALNLFEDNTFAKACWFRSANPLRQNAPQCKIVQNRANCTARILRIRDKH
jgi:hypothetical protein